MKSAGVLATFVIFCAQNVRGQQNDSVNNQITETNNVASNQQPSQTVGNIVQRYLNQNGKTGALSNTFNQRQGLMGQMELNSPRPLTNTEKLQQPPDPLKQAPPLQPRLPQQQKLPFQQFTQLQQPLQQPPQVQQPLQMQPSLGLQQNSLQPGPSFQESTDLMQTQFVPPQSNYKPPSHSQLHLKLQPTNPQGVNIVQSLNTQNVIQPQQNPNPRPAEVIAPQHQAPNINQDIPTVRYHISSQQPLSPSPSNFPVASNPSIALVPSYNIKPVEETCAPSYNYINPVSEIQPTVIELPSSTNTVQALPSVITLPSSIVQNSQTPTQSYYYGQTSDPRQSIYVNQNPYIYPYQTQTSPTAGQVQPIVVKAQPATLQAQPAALQAQPITVKAQPITVQAQPVPVQAQPITVQAQPLPIQAQPVPVQAQPITVQVQPATVQVQPTPVISSQSSILPNLPVSMFQTSQVSPQYAISSAYPVNTYVPPIYSTQKAKSLNLKSLLPLIINLLKEKISSDGCQNGCQCECKKNFNNDPEVLSGYSSQKHYGVLKDDGPSILNTVSEELEDCLRKRKNCSKHENTAEKCDDREVSEESQENEESDEEEASDDEED